MMSMRVFEDDVPLKRRTAQFRTRFKAAVYVRHVRRSRRGRFGQHYQSGGGLPRPGRRRVSPALAPALPLLMHAAACRNGKSCINYTCTRSSLFLFFSPFFCDVLHALVAYSRSTVHSGYIRFFPSLQVGQPRRHCGLNYIYIQWSWPLPTHRRGNDRLAPLLSKMMRSS